MTKFWVSRAFQPVLDTVFDTESEFSNQNRLNLQETQKIRPSRSSSSTTTTSTTTTTTLIF